MRSADAWCAPITGFRGLAAVAVAMTHSLLSARTYPIAGIVQIVGVIVPMFFVISAYALYRPFIVDQLEGRKSRRAGSFWRNRLLRIYPLYAVSLTAYLVLLPGLRPKGGSIVHYAELYTFTWIYDPALRGELVGIPAAWFLADEVAFYLMIPALAAVAGWLARRRANGERVTPRRILSAHASVAITLWILGATIRPALVLSDPWATVLPISNLDFYGLGILISVATLWERQGFALPEVVTWIRDRPWTAPAGMAVGAVVIELAATDPANWTPEQNVIRYLMWTVMAVPAMIYLIVGDQDAPVNRWLSDGRWAWLGALSLHIYLWHQLVLGVFNKYVHELAELHVGSRFTTGLITSVGCALASIALSAALRPALDWPHDHWAARLSKPRRRRSAPSQNKAGPPRREPDPSRVKQARPTHGARPESVAGRRSPTRPPTDPPKPPKVSGSTTAAPPSVIRSGDPDTGTGNEQGPSPRRAPNPGTIGGVGGTQRIRTGREPKATSRPRPPAK